jgi:DNA-binding NarL/FixJ family response regulator
MMDKIRVILADDHPLIRAGFKSLLDKIEAFSIVGEAENGKELLEIATAAKAHVALVDISMPQLNGLDAIPELKKLFPDLKILVLTMHEEPEYILKAVKLGAEGYVLKNTDSNELAKAINTVYQGGKYFSPNVAAILAETVSRPVPVQVELSPREKEVLQMVAAGDSTKQIAGKLELSIRTIETHRINLLKKFDVNNSAELIRKAIELKFI